MTKRAWRKKKRRTRKKGETQKGLERWGPSRGREKRGLRENSVLKSPSPKKTGCRRLLCVLKNPTIYCEKQTKGWANVGRLLNINRTEASGKARKDHQGKAPGTFLKMGGRNEWKGG